MREVIIAHTNDTLKDYINESTNDIISSATIVVNDGVSISKVAEDISRVLFNTENILVLSLESHIVGSNPSELKAAELIYHLRATHQLTNPIVVVAMQTLSGILRQQPDLTILNAQGVYFADILSNFSFLTKIKTHYKRYAVKDIKKEYLRHFQNKLNAAQVRHEQANIYGLKQLVKIHKAVTGDEIIIAGLNTKDNLDFLLADFVFGENDKQYAEIYNNDEELDKAYVKNLAKIEDRDVFIIDDQSKIWLPFYKAQLEGANVVDFDFDANHFDTDNNIGEDDWIALKAELSQEKDWIILLDLRINPNEDNNRALESISGILLLKRIKQAFPYIPIIITTASNKSKTLAKLASMKVDGYWVKEGIDNGWTAKESVENYFKLPELVTKASNEIYITLKYFYKITSILKENGFWFNKSSNTLIPDYNVDKFYERTLLEMQNNLFTIFKRHCRDFTMNFNYSEDVEFEKEEQLSLAGILNGIGSFTEILLGYNIQVNRTVAYNTYKDNIESKLLDRTNEIRIKIERYRNNVSHAQLAKFATYENLTKMIELLLQLIQLNDIIKNQVSYYFNFLLEENKADLIFERSWSPHYCKIVHQEDKKIVGVINIAQPRKNAISKKLVKGKNRQGKETAKCGTGSECEDYKIYCLE